VGSVIVAGIIFSSFKGFVGFALRTWRVRAILRHLSVEAQSKDAFAAHVKRSRELLPRIAVAIFSSFSSLSEILVPDPELGRCGLLPCTRFRIRTRDWSSRRHSSVSRPLTLSVHLAPLGLSTLTKCT